MLLALLLLAGCVTVNQFQQSEEQERISLFDRYYITVESRYHYGDSSDDDEVVVTISPSFITPISDTAGADIDTIPVLKVDSICIRTEIDSVQECVGSFTYDDYCRELVLAGYKDIRELKTGDLYIHRNEIRPYTILPLCRRVHNPGCKILYVSFTADLIDRTSGEVLGSEDVAVVLKRISWKKSTELH